MHKRRGVHLFRMILIPMVLIGVWLSACSSDDDEVTALDRTTSGGTEDVLMVSVDPSEQFSFAPAVLTAKANEPIKIQFSSPVALPHTLVLVEPGKEDPAINAGLANGGAVPPGTAGVLAASDVLDQGEIAMLDVPDLAPGEYPYICTVPGHYEAGMHGTLTVQP